MIVPTTTKTSSVSQEVNGDRWHGVSHTQKEYVYMSVCLCVSLFVCVCFYQDMDRLSSIHIHPVLTKSGLTSISIQGPKTPYIAQGGILSILGLL